MTWGNGMTHGLPPTGDDPCPIDQCSSPPRGHPCPNQTRTRSGCEACEGTGLVYQDNPERPGYLLADECGACQGLGEL
jgi:hypothetical protein